MKYVIKSVTPDGEQYFYYLKKYDIEFVKRKKYAKQYGSWDSAQLMKQKLMLLDESLHLTIDTFVEEPVRVSEKCSYDCFNCPYDDCINGRPATRLERELVEKAVAASEA